MRQFVKEKNASRNPLIHEFFGAFEKCQQRELAAQARLAMVHAAIAYKLKGDAGVSSVQDPLDEGPFAHSRAMIQGVDRGLRLSSAYAGRGQPETMIFVEKNGPPFRVDGLVAGQLIPMTPPEK